MGTDPGRPARVATFVLMSLVYAACEVAAYPDGRPRPFGVGYGLAMLALAVGLSWFTPAVLTERPSRGKFLLLAAGLGLPVAVEPVLRNLSGQGFPLELQLVNGLRTFGLLLCGLAAWPRCRRLAGVLALFLALFATAMGDQPAIPYLLGALALAGGVWLVLNHRADTRAIAGAVVGEEIDRAALRLPYREAAVFGLLAVAAGGVAVAGPKRVMLQLGELMPTSGGTGATDPFARYGIGDGPEEVTGENAKAAGMVETDRMIEDTQDALIDAVNDMYGPPHKPPKERDRMIAAGLMEVIQNHGKLPDNKKPSRDFDTGRTGPKRDGLKPESTAARALFEVEGRTPLHVRLVAYDRYDSPDHRWREARKPGNRLLGPDGGDWMKLGHLRAADWYAADDRHRLKTAALRDNLVPTPSLLTRVRINKVDKPDYYEWDFDGVLALAGRRKTPPGVVVVTDCRTLDPARLPASAFATPTAAALVAVPAEYQAELGRLAAEWASGCDRGWPQIAAVVGRLRSDFILDPTATAPSDVDPLGWFLADSRHGPDYLFATGAALLLRALGYPTRVCLGYYAAPAAFDADTGHTPVKRSDLHVWPEVLLADGHWLPLEPTPGYSTLPPLKPWQERLADAVSAVVAWVGRNVVPVTTVAVLAVFGVWRRREVVDGVHTLGWFARPSPSDRVTVLRAVAVLERRGRLAGVPRRADQSLAEWARDTGGHELAALVRLAEWAAYAPGLPLPSDGGSAREVCRAALRRWTRAEFRAVYRGTV